MLLSNQVRAMAFVAAWLLVCATNAFAQQGRDVREGPLHAALRRGAAGWARSIAADQQSAKRPNQSWILRHPVIVGTLIGAGAGAALSRIDAIGGANHDARVTLIGAGAGAWGGLAASAIQKSHAKERIGLGTKIGIVAGAVGLVVVPIAACYGAGGCGGSS